MKGKKTGGRRPGSPNKTTRVFREAVLGAFEDMGGQSALLKWGQENPTEFFKICARLIPTEVIGSGDSPVALKIELTDKIQKPDDDDPPSDPE